jgi:hypothetical protein
MDVWQAINAVNPQKYIDHIPEYDFPDYSSDADPFGLTSDLIQLRLFDGLDSQAIQSALYLSKLSYLEKIATWHQGFATPDSVTIHRDLRRGEAQLALSVATIKSSRFETICPWTGRNLETEHSFVVQSLPYSVPLYAYRFVSNEVFYVMIIGSVSCLTVGALFPCHNLYVSFDRTDDRDGFQKYAVPLKEFLLRNPSEVLKYITGKSQKCGVIVAAYHFAHHLWNELSALDGLLCSGNDDFHVWALHSPFGPVDRLFPEVKGDRFHDRSNKSFEEVAVEAMATGVLWAPLGRTYIPKGVITRIQALASEIHTRDVVFSRNISEAVDFVLWVSIRTDTRVCTNQVALISNIIAKSQELFGNVAVIFDGHTPGYRGGVGAETRDAEDCIVEEIFRISKTPFVGISLVGASLLQAVVWGAVADYYVANHGTIQHKIGWLHEISGICHYFFRDGFFPENFGALYASEGGTIPEYFFGVAEKKDVRLKDLRTDLFSYSIDIPKFISAYEVCVSKVSPAVALGDGYRTGLFKIREDPHLQEEVNLLLQMGDRAWASQDIPSAIRYFADAWSAGPKFKRSMNRFIEFALMNLVSWYRGHELAETRVIALQLLMLLNRHNKWAKNQVAAEVLRIVDNVTFLRVVDEIRLRFPEMADDLNQAVKKRPQRDLEI